MTSAFPPLTRADVLATSFSSWYPRFKKVAPKATVLKPLQADFIDYLESDRLFIPAGSGPIGLSELSDDESGNGSESSQDQSWQITFPELDAHIRRVIIKYEGAVFPKLNWSSPQDAAWMVPGEPLKCQSPADVYLLLKSSDFISHDLDHAFDLCIDTPPVGESEVEPAEVTTLPAEESLIASTSRLELANDDESNQSSSDDEEVPPKKRIKRDYDFELVLKKWFDMPKSQEWRCFVRNKELLAITHRDVNYYKFLQPAEVTDDLRSKILDFFRDQVLENFPSESYVFDIYFTRSNERIFLIDFSPYGLQTDTYLYTWDELHSLSTVSSPPPIRIVNSSEMSARLPAFSHNRYPKDVVDLSSGASIREFADKWKETLEEGVKATVGPGKEREGR